MERTTEKKAWQTPEVVVYGRVSDVTLDPPKSIGIHDNVPFSSQVQCPPGQVPCSL